MSQRQSPSSSPATGSPDATGAWRERGGVVEVRAHRVKTWLFVFLFVALGGGSAAWAVAEPRELWAWAGVLLFGVAGAAATWQYWRRGLLAGRAVLILSPEGLHDRQSGLRVTWDNVERVEFWEMTTHSSTQRFLGLDVHDPERLELGRGHRVGLMLSRAVAPGRPEFNVSTNLLATTTEELAGLVARFYKGPIHGIEEIEGPIDRIDEIATTAERPSRTRRFATWVREWAIALAIGIPLVALIVWLTE